MLLMLLIFQVAENIWGQNDIFIGGGGGRLPPPPLPPGSTPLVNADKLI